MGMEWFAAKSLPLTSSTLFQPQKINCVKEVKSYNEVQKS